MTEPGGIEVLIFEMRGLRVILAADLARIYGVETRALNQAVRRNVNRFPPDFLFLLTRNEASVIGASRSQGVILKRGQNVKYLPLAFTEHGAMMAAMVLSSSRAIEMSVFVVRAFLRLRALTGRYREVTSRLDAIERKVAGHDKETQAMFAAIRGLLSPVLPSQKRRIGFRPRERG